MTSTDDRLREAALALYLERGFEQTMVADIADRAGVTARPFFRYFADMATAELRERELIKLAQMSAALAEGLRRRGAGDVEAGLAAETGAAVSRVAFQRWVDAADDLDLREAIRQSFAHLRALTASG